MTIPQFQTRLLLSFPPQTHDSLVQVLCRGISKADEHMRTTPQFGGNVGQDLKGHIRRIFVLHEFEDLSRRRLIDYEAKASKMPVGSWHWVHIKAGGLIAHVVRTETPDGFPERTPNRKTLVVTNQYDLLKDGRIPPVELAVTKARYAYLTFGVDDDGTVTHVSLGMPSHDNTHWLAFVKLLRRSKPEPLIIAPPAPRTPPPELRFVAESSEEGAINANNGNDKKTA